MITKKFAVTIAMLLLAMVFISCKNASTESAPLNTDELNTDKQKLVGTWIMTDGAETKSFTFNSDTSVTLDFGSEGAYSGTWNVTSSTLTIISADGETETFVYSLNGNTLTLTARGVTVDLTRQ